MALPQALRQLFAVRPDAPRAEYSSSHLSKGNAYHDRFTALPGRRLMWEMEQAVIADFVHEVAPRRILDVATGTGRIANLAASCCDGAVEVHGVDISESMLTVARANGSEAHFHLMDGRGAAEYFGAGRFDLVSAFRFFPNADDALREDMADQIATLVAPGGFVMFNNHRNYWSPSYIARRFTGRGTDGASNVELESLFTQRGFLRQQRISIGVWPQSESRSLGIPWLMTGRIERINLRYFSRIHSLGYNTLFLLQKPHAS